MTPLASMSPVAEAESRDLRLHFQSTAALVREDDKYCADSETYQLKGGFIAELIQNPAVRFLEKGILDQVVTDLQEVTMSAMGKTTDEVDIFAPTKVITKNAIYVDWLTVVRKEGRVVAFAASSFIDRDLLYIQSTMVRQEYQTHNGLGSIPNLYLWERIVERRRMAGGPEIYFVARTHNKNIASLLLHVLDNDILSTEIKENNHQCRDIMKRTIKYLECNYDENSGISKNVYPEGIPAGNKTSSNRINDCFRNIGPKDACYIIGTLNLSITKRFVRAGMKKENAEIIATIPEPVLAVA